ncbi:MAG: hypothetical protein LJE94_16970 [Deltaproteobacteria bacterium]|nr:hypothetical protein [Deltaproteobacteria bacterium]
MSEKLRVNGIKLSLEMTLITIRAVSGERDPNAHFLKLMGENRVNLPLLCATARGGETAGSYCILTEDIPRAKNVVSGDNTLTTHIQFLPSVGSISVFPHNFNLEFLGLMLRLVGEAGAPLHALATSISALCLVTDFSLLEKTADCIAGHVTLPGNHSPFRPDIRVKSM